MANNNVFSGTAMDDFLAGGEEEQTNNTEVIADGAEGEEQTDAEDDGQDGSDEPDGQSDNDGQEDNADGTEGDDSEVTVAALLAEQFGLEGQYEQTEDGIKQLYADINAKFASTQQEDDDVKALLAWKAQGGTAADFMQQQQLLQEVPLLKEVDEYTEEELEQVEAYAENVIAQDIKASNPKLKDAAIKAMIDGYKDEGILIEEANNVIKDYNESNKKLAEEREQKLRDDFKKAEEEGAKIWAEVNTTLDKNNLIGVPIAKDKMAELKTAITPDKTGKVPLDEKRKALSVGQELFIDYLIMTNFEPVKTLMTGSKNPGNSSSRKVAGGIVKKSSTKAPSLGGADSDNGLGEINEAFRKQVQSPIK